MVQMRAHSAHADLHTRAACTLTHPRACTGICARARISLCVRACAQMHMCVQASARTHIHSLTHSHAPTHTTTHTDTCTDARTDARARIHTHAQRAHTHACTHRDSMQITRLPMSSHLTTCFSACLTTCLTTCLRIRSTVCLTISVNDIFSNFDLFSTWRDARYASGDMDALFATFMNTLINLIIIIHLDTTVPHHLPEPCLNGVSDVHDETFSTTRFIRFDLYFLFDDMF